LTELRSPYDSTEAYITNENRSLSIWYALRLWNYIINTVSIKIHIPKSMVEMYLKEAKEWQKSFSAQGWIDTYNYLLENGEMDIVKEILSYK